MKTIRIGGGQAFWGDLSDAPITMAREDNLDYICCDYLAELTLSIMRRQQEKRPEAGYARDFITALKRDAALYHAEGHESHHQCRWYERQSLR